jgi:hypothetical protein
LITIAMPNDTRGRASADIPMPMLSDDAVVQIHDFITHVLDLFEARYGDQIHRYYDDRSAHNLIRCDTPPNIDDPPF